VSLEHVFWIGGPPGSGKTSNIDGARSGPAAGRSPADMTEVHHDVLFSGAAGT